MKIVHLLPGLEVGGVETHVVDLASEQARLGHQVTVISGGGRMVSQLHPGVTHIIMAVHRKNPITGAICAVKLARMARSRGWDVLHAHSRVPAWIAWWTSRLSGVPFIVTCHAIYSLNAGLTPYRHADGAICVSKAVMDHQRDWLPTRTVVIKNGIPDPGVRWSPEKGAPFRFLFVGRLTKVKGIDFLISAFLPMANRQDWILDIAGEGPLEEEIREKVASAGLGDRISFLGYRDDVAELLAKSHCCLFPSRSEGAGLVLLTALAVGTPVIASDLPAFREILDDRSLIPMEASIWTDRLTYAIDHPDSSQTISPPRSIHDMVAEVGEFCSKFTI